LTVLKSLTRRFGIRAPRVAVRTHMPWYLRWLGMAVTGTLVAVFCWWAYHFGQRFAGFDQHEAEVELKRIAASNDKLEKENAQLKSELAVIERQLQIERATFSDLGRQVKGLAGENAALKEDLAFFDTLTTPTGKTDGVNVSRLQVESNTVPGEYRYRVLLLLTGPRTKAFEGTYELVVNATLDGRRVVATFPERAERSAKPYQLNFRAYQRVDGTFKLTPGAQVKSVQVRVFENGQSQPRVMHSVNVS